MELPVRHFLLVPTLMACITATQVLADTGAKLAPAKVDVVQAVNDSYKKCRKTAVSAFWAKKLNRAGLSRALVSCKEYFPGANLYIACKAKVLKKTRKENLKSLNLESCRRYLLATMFDPEEPIPFFFLGGSKASKAFFAGIGLNESVSISGLRPPNFNCSRLSFAVQDPNKADYVLFGNHPAVFEGLRGLNGSQLLKKLRIAKAGPGAFIVPGFGMVRNTDRYDAMVTLFPTGACDFAGKLGDLFTGASCFYLIDHAIGLATPYFCTAYYNPEQNDVETAELVDGLNRILGKKYSELKVSETMSFLTAGKVSVTGAGRELKDLCGSPRPHRFIGAVQANKDYPSKPEYLLLANIRNLCKFGDRLAKRLTPGR